MTRAPMASSALPATCWASADILNRALSSTPGEIADPAFKNFVAGIDMTEKELAGVFDRNGVKKIAPLKGDKFDPNLHQAVTEQPADDVPGGSVLMVMQAGYELFGRVIRPAMVAVSAKTAAPQPAPGRQERLRSRLRRGRRRFDRHPGGVSFLCDKI